MSINIPSINTAPTNIGKNASDYEKFVIVDTAGSLVDAGSVAYSLDLVKDDSLQAKADFLKDLFDVVGMEFKVREARVRTVAKTASVAEIMKGLAKK